MRLTLEQRRWLWAYAFLALPILFFLSIRIAPTLYAFWMSFHKWDPMALSRPWNGLDNYRAMRHDDVFWKAMRNTWAYVVLGVPISMAASLGIALGLQRLTRYVGFYRVVFFAPYVTSLIAVGWVWRWMYMPNGFFNAMFGKIGLGPYPFLQSPDTALYSILIMTMWQGLGFQIIIFLAGLESIPATFQEAAAVDGANGWQQFRSITVPLLNPTIVFLTVVGVINYLQVFTQIRAMSSGGTGGPLGSTISIVLYVYQQAFASLPSKMGYASAVTVVLFLMILVITVIQLRILQRFNSDY